MAETCVRPGRGISQERQQCFWGQVAVRAESTETEEGRPGATGRLAGLPEQEWVGAGTGSLVMYNGSALVEADGRAEVSMGGGGEGVQAKETTPQPARSQEIVKAERYMALV